MVRGGTGRGAGNVRGGEWRGEIGNGGLEGGSGSCRV